MILIYFCGREMTLSVPEKNQFSYPSYPVCGGLYPVSISATPPWCEPWGENLDDFRIYLFHLALRHVESGLIICLQETELVYCFSFQSIYALHACGFVPSRSLDLSRFNASMSVRPEGWFRCWFSSFRSVATLNTKTRVFLADHPVRQVRQHV